MSEIKVNSIVDASGGSTVQVNGYTPTMSNMAGRNKIINGDMRIDARNAGASVTPTNGQYLLDRYQVILSQASKYSVQQVTDAPVGFTNSMRVTSLSAYSVVASDIFHVMQKIEGFNVADLAWGTANAQAVTVSFWAKSSLTGTFGGSLVNSAEDRSYPFTYTISSANTWEYKTVTVAGDTTGTWLTNNGIGIRCHFTIGMGSNYTDAAGAWTAGAKFAPTGATNLVATNGATLAITGVQLEAGSVATPFEHVDYSEMLRRCQRYYEQNDAGATNGVYAAGYSSANNAARYVWFYKVPKRAAATITVSSGAHFFGQTGSGSNVATTTLAGNLSGINQTSLSAGFAGTSFTIGQGSQLVDNNAGASWIAASAEL